MLCTILSHLLLDYSLSLSCFLNTFLCIFHFQQACYTYRPYNSNSYSNNKPVTCGSLSASQRENSDSIPDPSMPHFWLTMWQCAILLTEYTFVTCKYYSANNLHTSCVYHRRHLSLVTGKVVKNLGLFECFVKRTRLFC